MSDKRVDPKGKVAFVSGANRGIGKAITIALLEHGINKVYAGARNTSSLKELQEKYSDRLVPVQLDVTNPSSIASAASQVDELDILVNNAGVLAVGKIFSAEANKSLEQNLNVNVWGLINLSNALIDKLNKEEVTSIINISSLAGLGNMPFASTYSISKAAVHSITQGMRAELLEKNTLVMGVYPGPIETDMTTDLDMEKDSPENVARTIVEGLKNGDEDIFPDVMSKQAGEFYATSPKAVEKQFATFA